MASLILYPLLCATFFYLGSRAVITTWLWSRYPRKLAVFFDCAACAGTWYGLLIAVVGGEVYHLDFLGLDGTSLKTWIVVAFASTAWTPLVAALHQQALSALGSAIEESPSTESMDQTSIPNIVPEPNDSTMPIPSTQRHHPQPPPLQLPLEDPDSSASDQKDPPR